MSLTYLSGDEIGKPKKPLIKKKTAEQKATKKAERKQAVKRVTKTVKKVGVAPARGAFLTAVSLNALKLADKLVVVWKNPGGKDDLKKFWEGLGGDINLLKKAIIKGSKQQISGDSVNAAIGSVLALATPIIEAIAKLFKKHKAAKSAKEAKEFDKGLEQAKKDLAKDETIPTAEVNMPANREVGIVTDRNGMSVTDPNARQQSESRSGGYDGSTPPPESGGGLDDGAAKPAPNAASNWSPLGFFFMILMYTMLLGSPDANRFVHIDQYGQIVIGILQIYCLIAMLAIPFAIGRISRFQRICYTISFAPMDFINRSIKRFTHG